MLGRRIRNAPFSWRHWVIVCAIAVLITLYGFDVAHADDPVNKTTPPDATALPVMKLVVVSDDDFLANAGSVWCQDEISNVVAICQKRRPAVTLEMEWVQAGSPSILRDAQALPPGPRRALCCLCNQDRKIIGLWVGIPTENQLMSHLELADELSIAISLEDLQSKSGPAPDEDTETISPVVELVRDHAANRVSRHYRVLLDRIAPFRSIDQNAETLAGALAQDIRERFLFDSLNDAERWISIQQHAEARKHWCLVMLIGVVNRPVAEVWPDLARSVWGAMPWQRSESAEAFAEWIHQSTQSTSVLVEIDSDRLYLGSELFRDATEAKTASRQAQDSSIATVTQGDAKHFQFRRADLCDIAVALKDMDHQPIELRASKGGNVRWLLWSQPGEPVTLFPERAHQRLAMTLSKLEN